MKTFIYLFVLALNIVSCSRNESNPDVPKELIGKWVLKETLYSNGGESPVWQNVSNGYIIEVNNSANFTSTQFSDCNSGNLNVSDNIITFDYNCGNSTIPNKFKIISITNSELILSNINCDEECKDKFVKQ